MSSGGGGIAARCVATFFGIGHLPFAPGTWGSLAGMALLVAVRGNAGAHLLLSAVLIAAGFAASGRAERSFGRKDPSCIVIDEVACMVAAFLFVPADPRLLWPGFFLFRIFDTLKPYPAGRIQRLGGSAGIMADDIIAAAYTNLVLQVLARTA